MHQKVALGIAQVYSEEKCGVPDAALVDFHDFDYQSTTGSPVAVALSFRFCPWCGVERDSSSQTRRNIEVIRPRYET
jgi:hypothetical protein